MRSFILVPPLMLLASCGATEPDAATESPEPTEQADPQAGWQGRETDEGWVLLQHDEAGAVAIRMNCSGDPPRFEVFVGSFDTIGSEERLSVGIGDEILTLVADTARPQGAGVSGTAPLPLSIETPLRSGGDIGAAYGAQTFGPVDPPPAQLAERLIESCAAMGPVG